MIEWEKDRLLKLRPMKLWERFLNNKPRRRLDWKQMEPQGGLDVMKGISHRVIVVKSPDKYFEEAIFVIREDVLKSRGADSQTILLQAQRVANSYVKRAPRRRKSIFSKLPAPFFVAAGAAATTIAWLTLRLCGV
jgi:hypothetical protein